MHQFRKTPSFIKTLEDWELEDLENLLMEPPSIEGDEGLLDILRNELERRKEAEKPMIKPSHVQLAIFYRLLVSANLYPEFDGSSGKTKDVMCKEIGLRHGISGDKFEQVFNKTKPEKASIADLTAAVRLLDKPEYQKAKDRAETLLKQAKANKGIK